MKKVRYLILILWICTYSLISCGCQNEPKTELVISQEGKKKEPKSAKKKQVKTKKIQVYVCGEVKNPGVYELDATDRIVSAIKAAGGLTKKAVPESVNQAQKMEDGQQIYIPSKSESRGDSNKEAGEIKSSSLISLNQATKEELMTLPGIGQSKAEAILSYRQEHGGFSRVEDLMKITGIKDGVYNKIKDYITL